MRVVWRLNVAMCALESAGGWFLPELLEISVVVAVCGVVFGGLLDYLALRKTRLV